MSVRGVQAVLARLIGKGLVEILAKGNQYSATQFALHLDKGQQKPEFIPSRVGGDRNKPAEYAKGAAAMREAAFRAGMGEHANYAGTSEHVPNSMRSSTYVNPQIIPMNPQIDASEPARSSHEPSEKHQTTVREPSVESSVLTDDDVEAMMRTLVDPQFPTILEAPATPSLQDDWRSLIEPSQLEAATTLSPTDTIPAEVPL